MQGDFQFNIKIILNDHLSLAINAEIMYYYQEVYLKECFDAVYCYGLGVE